MFRYEKVNVPSSILVLKGLMSIRSRFVDSFKIGVEMVPRETLAWIRIYLFVFTQTEHGHKYLKCCISMTSLFYWCSKYDEALVFRGDFS